MGCCNCSMLFCALLCVLLVLQSILMGKRELVALFCLSSWCLVIVVWLFLTAPWVCLHFVIVVFPDHTHLLFLGYFIIHVKGYLFLNFHNMKYFDIDEMHSTSYGFLLFTKVPV